MHWLICWFGYIVSVYHQRLLKDMFYSQLKSGSWPTCCPLNSYKDSRKLSVASIKVLGYRQLHSVVTMYVIVLALVTFLKCNLLWIAANHLQICRRKGNIVNIVPTYTMSTKSKPKVFLLTVWKLFTNFHQIWQAALLINAHQCVLKLFTWNKLRR